MASPNQPPPAYGSYVTARDRWKNFLVELLENTVKAEMEGELRRYSKGCRNLIRLLKKHVRPDIQLEIEKEYVTFSEALKDNDQADATRKQREADRTNKTYMFYTERIFPYIIDAFNTSDIIEKEIEGDLIIEDLDHLKKTASEIRRPIKARLTQEALIVEGAEVK